MFYRRQRSVADQLLQPPGTPTAELRLEARLARWQPLIRAEALLDRAKWGFTNDGSYRHFPQEDIDAACARMVSDYFAPRRVFLYTDGGSPARGALPDPSPAHLTLAFGAYEASPASGNQDEEFVQILNPNDVAVDVTGWAVRGGIEHDFHPGTVIPAGGSLYLSPAKPAFLTRATGPRGGQGLFVQGNYTGHLSNLGETLDLLDPAGAVVATLLTPAEPTLLQQFLVLSEIHYHPPDPHGEAEFLELWNRSPTATLDLSGCRFTTGIDFIFPPGTTLAPGARLVIAKNPAAFVAVHGAASTPFGPFANGTGLSNSGETLKLEDAANQTIFEIAYSDRGGWSDAADGSGPSLVFRDGDPADPSNWRASLAAQGNPFVTDSLFYTGNPNDSAALLAHATGGLQSGITALGGGTYLLTARLHPAADDIIVTWEISENLQSWSPVTEYQNRFRQRLSASEETDSATFLLPAETTTAWWRVRFTLRQ